MTDEEEEVKGDRGAFADMFGNYVKNFVEFKDKRNNPRKKVKVDQMNDIVLCIQNESDFYQAWDNAFHGVVDDYQNDEDGERYKASQTTWIESLPEILTFQMQRTKYEKENKKMVKN